MVEDDDVIEIVEEDDAAEIAEDDDVVKIAEDDEKSTLVEDEELFSDHALNALEESSPHAIMKIRELRSAKIRFIKVSLIAFYNYKYTITIPSSQHLYATKNLKFQQKLAIFTKIYTKISYMLHSVA